MKPIELIASAALLTAAVPAAAAELTGRQVFDRHCVHCHGPGNEGPGTLQLARTRGPDKALLAERNDLPAAYIQMIVRQGLKAMPAFVPSDLTDAQLKVLADYLATE
jgi:mono/diheme cytochrome c family protein